MAIYVYIWPYMLIYVYIAVLENPLTRMADITFTPRALSGAAQTKEIPSVFEENTFGLARASHSMSQDPSNARTLRLLRPLCACRSPSGQAVHFPRPSWGHFCKRSKTSLTSTLILIYIYIYIIIYREREIERERERSKSPHIHFTKF